MSEIVLVHILGKDQSGVMKTIADLLVQHAVKILDINQAVVHDHVTLGLLIQLAPRGQGIERGLIFRDLIFYLTQKGLNVKFLPVEEAGYEQWAQHQHQPKSILTLLARHLTGEQLLAISSIVSRYGLNIVHIHRLSWPPSLELSAQQKVCVEFGMSGEPNEPDQFRAELLHAAGRIDADIAFQKDNAYRRNRRLVVFDMDSTLIEGEVIDELAKRAGVGVEVMRVTELAMRGELDFKASFARRLNLLKGLSQSVLDEVLSDLRLTEGAERLVKTLKALGFKTAIVSGGFSFFGQALQRRLGIDHMFANELEVESGYVTGRVKGDVVDGARKAQIVRQLAAQEDIELEQVIAVGDGANDLPMLKIAGLGIAFRAKPIVEQTAKQAISTLGLDGILYLLGVRDSDQIDLIDG